MKLSQPYLGECEDENHTPEWGLGSPPGLPKIQSSIAGSKHLALACSLYHWKVIEV